MNHINVILIIFVILFAILFYLHFQKKESFEGIAGSSFVSRVPKGTIVAYYPPGGDLSKNPVPVGWHVCDGTQDTPDLRGRFIRGYDPGRSNNIIGSTGGEEQVTLSLEQIPSHTHGISQALVGVPSGWAKYGDGGEQATTVDNTGSAGGKDGITQPHDNLPPFYVLVYIMKL